MSVPASVMTQQHGSGSLVAVDGRSLPLQSTTLSADANGGLARVIVEQTFHNAHKEPLHVTYLLPLPLEAAVSGFTFVVNDNHIVGEIDRRGAARERFEKALVDGHSAALLEEDRSTLFRQEVGNIPAGADVRVEITLDQRLTWVDGGWEWRFPTVVAPRYLAETGRVEDAARMQVDVANRPSSPPLTLRLAIRDVLAAGGQPSSPSHALNVVANAQSTRVEFGAEQEALDRDVVVRWPVTEPNVSVRLDTARPAIEHARSDEMYGLLTIQPPENIHRIECIERDVIVLLDTSGSMHGRPLDQAKAIVSSVIESLGPADQLEMIEFSNRPNRWKRSATFITGKARRGAHHWLAGLEASGATEMRSAVKEALHSLRADAQRQVLLVTDGHIGFEHEVVASILHDLPANSRLHTIGVGSAVNRSLLGPAARAGRGTEVVVGLDEETTPAADRLVAALMQPLVVNLEIGGDAWLEHTPSRLPDLCASHPATIALRLHPDGGSLTLRGRSLHGEWSQSVTVAAREPGEGSNAVTTLFAREAVEDLEMRAAAVKDYQTMDAEIEEIGLRFKIATRLTTWIAVSEAPAVDARQPSRRETMPQQLPYGMSVERLGLRGGALLARASLPMARRMASDRVRSRLSQEAFIDAAGQPLGEPTTRMRRAPPRKPLHRKQTFKAVGVVRDSRSIVLHIIVPDDCDWQPGRKVKVVLADGKTREVRVVASRTTYAGLVKSGQAIRLGLALFDGGIVRVLLPDGSEIEVEGA